MNVLNKKMYCLIFCLALPTFLFSTKVLRNVHSFAFSGTLVMLYSFTDNRIETSDNICNGMRLS